MSRKASADKSSWKTPSIFAFVGGYGPFRAKAFNPIEQVVVLLYNGDEGKIARAKEERRCHAMYSFAGEAQGLLLKGGDASLQDLSVCNGLLVVDIRDMFDDQAEMDSALKNEAAQDTTMDIDQAKKRSEKGLSRLLVKIFKRLRLHNIVLAAKNGELCTLALKLHNLLLQTDPNMIAGLHLIYPELSAKFINTHMVTSNSSPNGITHKMNEKKQAIPLHLVVAAKENSRVDMLRHCFPQLTVCTLEPTTSIGALAMGPKQEFDPKFCDPIGKSLFVSSLTVEMNRDTKQYARICEPITDRLAETMQSEPAESIPTNIDWDACEQHVRISRLNICFVSLYRHDIVIYLTLNILLHYSLLGKYVFVFVLALDRLELLYYAEIDAS
jgi:hypothetical protein